MVFEKAYLSESYLSELAVRETSCVVSAGTPPCTAKLRTSNFWTKGYDRQRHPKTAEKQQQQEKHHKRAAREARRPLCDPFFFLLSLRCRDKGGQVRSGERVLSLELSSSAQLCQVRVTPWSG